ncbi:putative C6 transcription factor (War1) [Aspergillus saccharolyticus JOP 1030-1]|uniref:Putative C6 transcription factor n=1 Tax=Aspergillus saccharolyticus JOP 1030-1 TaxID=1450539 RepID=A0A318ZB95_9EURO|nr:putative C6 transcription factor [Aspergillus saccharolyticus JOP 1030-1]PYH43614.1 putative C6 transcription factor [Aspergillus saccharolyticus JOP 1030-1]
MELDPRLHAGASDSGRPAERAETRPSYLQASASGHCNPLVASPAPIATDYPDSTPHLSPTDRLHFTLTASRGPNSLSSPQLNQPSSQHRSDSTSGLDTFPGTSLDHNDPHADLRRPRACDACRQLKVRCEPDISHPNGTCKRCAKAGRTCIVTAPTRKRQKKTDNRVAELERKIDALTASLQASQDHGPVLQSVPMPPPREEPTGRHWLAPTHAVPHEPPPLKSPPSMARRKRSHSGDEKEATPATSRVSSPSEEQSIYNKAIRQWRALGYPSDSTTKDGSREAVDIIDRGLVNAEIAAEAFRRYNEEMALLIPMVVFPKGTKMEDIRQKKPVLFHAITAVAVGTIQPQAQIPLINDFYRLIAEKVVVKGEKSLELVQSILVCCNWYTPPDNFEELKFYQLTHMAVTLAMDVGLYRKSMPRGKQMNLIRNIIAKKSSEVLDPDSPETRRTWLACYFVAVQVAVSLRRVNLVRWLPYMDECIEILEKSPDALPSDRTMVRWAKLAQIIEEIYVQFSSDDIPSVVSFSDPKSIYTLKVFEKQLEQWKRETLPEHSSAVIQQAYCIVNLYLHENALHVDYGKDEARTSGDEAASPTSATHISALSSCLTSIHEALDTICAIDAKKLLSAPTITLARTSFAVVALIKLYAIVLAPETRLGQVIDAGSLKMEYYLDKVIRHYAVAGELPGGRSPAKFGVVLSMLRNWFMKRKDQGPALKEALSVCCGSADCQSNNHDRSQNHSDAGQTPLHLLSEVAMGSSSQGRSSTTNPSAGEPPMPYLTGSTINNNNTSSSSSSSRRNPSATNHASISSDLASHSLGPSPRPISQAPPAPTSQPPSATDSTTEPWPPYSTAAPASSSRDYYPAFSSGMSDLPGYPNPAAPANSDGMLMMPQGFFVPELGVQMGFDPENLLALHNMIGDGFLNLPLQADEGMGFY